MKEEYIFTSERLGFRNWKKSDLDYLHLMNSDTAVMEFFPKTLNREESEGLLKKLENSYLNDNYTYFATETLKNGKFIGFIGLAYQQYESEFTPAVDIGWRLSKSAWGKGYATEGAKKCLEYGFQTLKIENIIATCTVNNTKSIKVMEKIGMKKIGIFNHPQLTVHPDYIKSYAFNISKDDWEKLI